MHTYACVCVSVCVCNTHTKKKAAKRWQILGVQSAAPTKPSRRVDVVAVGVVVAAVASFRLLRRLLEPARLVARSRAPFFLAM